MKQSTRRLRQGEHGPQEGLGKSDPSGGRRPLERTPTHPSQAKPNLSVSAKLLHAAQTREQQDAGSLL